MKVFIVLSALAALAAAAPSAVAPWGYHAGAPLGHDGRVVDTPEVAHAKAAHLAAHAHEAGRTAGYGHGAHGWAAPAVGAWAAPAVAYNYGAPVAHGWAAPAVAYGSHYAHGAAPLGHDGRVVDTPEVAHAKVAHAAAHAHEAAKTAGHGWGVHGAGLAYAAPAYGHGHAYGYGAAPIGHDGRVVDTPEVAHAKAAHAAAHAHEAAKTAGHGWGVHGAGLAYAAPAYGYGHAYGYGAAPIGHDGRVVDTPEVAHAKAAHFAAHAAASSHAHQW